ncbi:MAG: hypothetical protein NWQ55_00750, partial [Salibacteraceae bacterium]|nr:hypothetical protein [Salibacteraceae bacterium]
MEHIYHKIAEEILENSISVNDQIIDLETVVALREEATTDYENGAFEKARIGKGIGKQRIAEIRGDQVRWLDKNRATQAQLTYWKWIDGLRNYLSEFFRIHLERTELHFAYYPKGAFYSRHLDQFKEHSDRIFSIILYLNTEWKP